MSPTCKLWDLIVVEGLKQASHVNTIFLSIGETKACWRAILTCYLKNWMQKDKDKWSFDRLLWQIQTHSLMKWSISCLSASCTSMVHRNKMVPFIKLSIFMDLSNDIKFRSYTWWSINDIQRNRFLRWVNNHHINNEDLVFSGYVKIGS
jgi:hypothetical protein